MSRRPVRPGDDRPGRIAPGAVIIDPLDAPAEDSENPAQVEIVLTINRTVEVDLKLTGE